ncbi:Uncharacterised protein [Yersinia pekkanenii]|uniref:Uncharacterized protein n=1 Tax=Yersinia pekkanenii TaxID=1288385 RepID=A0A0T9NPA0_9GAMM|nr:Uncharacterised protein [Yersinia pekkanenii]CRY65980.1 Uncharacterised protein [Yersinia pekkanenii]
MLLVAVQDTSRNHRIRSTFLSLSLIKAAQIRAEFNWGKGMRVKRTTKMEYWAVLATQLFIDKGAIRCCKLAGFLYQWQGKRFA